MDPIQLLGTGLAILALGAAVTLFVPGKVASPRIALVAVLLAAGCFLALALPILLFGGEVGHTDLWKPDILPATLSVRIDALSAFFLVVISGVAVAATWFAVGYAPHMHGDLRSFYPPYLLFILGMAGVVVVDDFFFFFVPWEFMALSSYVLVTFHREKKENLAAGFRYFFTTHAGTTALFFGVALLVTHGAGTFQFSAIRAALPAMLASDPGLVHFALLLVLLGFLVKAGAFPFGMWWLPDAHPAAPSPVSALLSGVMIKLGLYGIVRVFFDLVPLGDWSFPWGVVVAIFGVLSLFYGTMAALIQHDSKRLLAYHSIGQVGYMLLGFGIGLAFARTAPMVAALGLIGGLFHLFNHACFKGLLFLNAGAFEAATGERDLNNLGGLGPILPVTAVCTVIASLSIAGLPLFNGFSSKWMLYHASIWGSQGIGVIFLFFGVVALFISAVTLASFLKFMGATIWGTPSPAAIQAKAFREGPWLGLAQGFLAFLCVAFGLVPITGAVLCYSAVQSLQGAATMPAFTAMFGTSGLTMAITDKGAAVGLWSPVIVGLVLLACLVLALGLRRLGAAPSRSVAPWQCGSDMDPEELRFRAGSYYTPFKRFVHLLMPGWEGAWKPEFPPVILGILDVDRWGYRPAVRGVLWLFRWFSKSHVGIPQVYAAWTVIGFTAALLFLILHKA